jgi:hypothetical protein
MPLATELAERGLDLLLNSGLSALSISASPVAHEADAQALARPQVLFFAPETRLRDALQQLAAARVLSAPVLASADGAEHQFLGFCDVAAILHHLLASLPAELLEDIVEASTDEVVTAMDALSSLAFDALAAPVSALPRTDGDLVSRNFASSSLLDVVQAAFTHPIHLRDVSICHRVAAADVRPELDASASLSSVSPSSMQIVTHMGECPVFAIAARLRVLTRVRYPFCLSQTSFAFCMPASTTWARWLMPASRRSRWPAPTSSFSLSRRS